MSARGQEIRGKWRALETALGEMSVLQQRRARRRTNYQPDDESVSSDCDQDRKDCDDMNPWECYEDSTRHDCCQTCEEYTVHPIVQGCEFGDHDSPCDVRDGTRCYDNSVRDRCCATCQDYRTDNPDCRYGDRLQGCESSECSIYTTKRLHDCCATCGTYDVTSSTTSSVTTTEWLTITSSRSQNTNTTVNPSVSSQTGVPTWAIPAAIGVGGLIVLLLIIIIVVIVRRNKRKSDRLSPIDEKMYNEYKLSKRGPMAPPRPLNTHKDWVIERKDSAEYAYINPEQVEGPEDNGRRSGNDPLPPTPSAPAEYLDLNDEAKYSYVQAEDTAKGRDTDQGLKRFNSYQLFPTSQTGTPARSDNEYLQPGSNQSSTRSRPYENGHIADDTAQSDDQRQRF